MDVHHTIPDGAGLADVAEAHAADLKIQSDYEVDYRHYWVDFEAGKLWCLVEAPDAEAAIAVHRAAHGLLADEIHPVNEG